MKTILCYGDSITWGYDPVSGMRFRYEDTWPAVMERSLGSDYKVISEALVGRTTCWDLPYAPYRNGKEYLPMLLESHSPIDLVIIMLGVNDLMQQLGKSADDSAWGLLALIRETLSPLFGGKPPQILIAAPPSLGMLSDFDKLAFAGKEEESKKLALCQKSVAETALCHFIDSNRFVKACDTDGVHLLPDQLKILGEAIAEKVRSIKL
mgnify:FL=1